MKTKQEQIEEMGKKMTDEDIVKDLEDYIREGYTNTPAEVWLDLIRRLQRENAEQKAEIERMARERETANKKDLMYWFKAYGECAEDCANYACENGVLQAKNSELQKQVDELTDKLGKVLSGIKADELLVAKGIEQAVKDTVKEILKEIKERFVASYLLPTGLDLPAKRVKYAKITEDELDELAKKYGVEVEE